MKLTYLDNSGYAVEIGDRLLVFDYCNPSPLPGKEGLDAAVVTQAVVDAHAKTTLLFSHSHSDHYTPAAFRLTGCQTILSFDFPPRFGIDLPRLRPGDAYDLGDLRVRAFGSTDLGCSYLVDVDGLRIFHAGDFNYWHWKEVSTQEEIEEAKSLFDAVLQPLLPFADSIDLCFFPVDVRLGPDADEGALLFAESLKPKYTVAIHMQGDAATGDTFVRRMAQKGFDALYLLPRGASVQIQ